MRKIWKPIKKQDMEAGKYTKLEVRNFLVKALLASWLCLLRFGRSSHGTHICARRWWFLSPTFWHFGSQKSNSFVFLSDFFLWFFDFLLDLFVIFWIFMWHLWDLSWNFYDFFLTFLDFFLIFFGFLPAFEIFIDILPKLGYWKRIKLLVICVGHTI